MPASKRTKQNNKTTASKVRARNFKEQTSALRVLIILIGVLGVTVFGILGYNQWKANDLKAKANRWTTITAPGADAGIRFVACKEKVGNRFDVTVVAAKDKSLELTKRDQNDKPLSTHPNFPNIYVGNYRSSTYQDAAYGRMWIGKSYYPPSSANRWWNNEVTATKLSNLTSLARGNDKLLVWGMSNEGNAPTFKQSGSGTVFPSGGFNGMPPSPEGFDNPSEYRQARSAWEQQVPTVKTLVNCQ